MDPRKVYHQLVGEKPNTLVRGCLEDFVIRRGASLDLGAGNLRDSRFLQSQGFTRLVAVDKSEDSLAFRTDGIELHIQSIETFIPEKDAFDFAFSCNTLFYLPPAKITDVLKNVYEGLRSGGVFAFNVLGQDDDWVVLGHPVSSFTEESLTALAADFEILGVGESRHHSRSVNEHGFSGNKFWHQLSIALRKP